MHLNDMFRLARNVALPATIVFGLLIAVPAFALSRTWIGGNVDWVETSGVDGNWSPNVNLNEPDAADEAIFNTANTVNLGTNNSIQALTMSGGIDLFMNDFDLSVNGLVQVVDASTNLFIGGAASTLRANNVTINNAADIEINGGVLDVHDFSLALGLLDINVGGELIGHGAVNLSEPPAVVTTLMVNDGAITAQSTPFIIFGEPPVGTLEINAPNAAGLGRVDLDGAGEVGVVNVNRNQTLDLNVAFADSFNGTMNLFQESHFNSLNAWTLAGGSIIANNGFIDGVLPNPDVPAGTSYIEGGLLTQTGGTINVPDTDGTLQMDVNFTMSGGTFTNMGTVIFNGTTNITAPGGYAPSSLNAQTIVNANVTINHPANDFNWDGNGASDTTVNGTALLSLNVNQVDSGDNVFGGTINLNDNADLSVNTSINQWQMFGTLNKNNVGTSSINGDEVFLNGIVNVNAGTLDINANLSFTNSTSLDVASGAALTASTTTIVGGNLDIDGSFSIGPLSTSTTPVVFNGTGSVQFTSTSSITVNTTVNSSTFDWDGTGAGSAHTINDGVVFTINSTTLDSDGDMDDPINLGGNGALLVVNGPTQWTMNQAINANNALVGTATIGGTSRLILTGANADLNVNGNTQITAPVTFDAGSTTSIDLGFFLDGDSATTYSGGTITGLGTYFPGASNTVTADSSITASTFDIDAGTWTIDPGATLTVNVSDYDNTVTNAFDGTITLHGGVVDMTTADAEFVMDGTLNLQSEPGNLASWEGEPVDIGNDAGALDANLNVTTGVGITGTTQFVASVDFNSDADVNVAAGRTLLFTSSSTVNFDTVNGVNNAEFTGSGAISFNSAVNVNEAVTLNMVGGTVDLDGTDPVGEFINIDAPFTINAATMSDFGKTNLGGINTLDVNNSVGTGVLTVNLDNATAEWTLNAPGVMNLVNDNVEATLLAGNDVNINGTLNVTGDVRTTARIDIGSTGVVNINTAGQPLRLAGGNDSTDPNTINGATISGVGLLGADTGKALHGFGTINTNIDFDGTANLRADNGTLTVNGAITDVNIIGTNDADGVLNIPAAWNTLTGSGAGSVADVQMFGGTLQGGTITNDNANGIQGVGTVASRVINNTRLLAGNGGGTLIVQTAGNDNDWDGSVNTGQLSTRAGAILELRDNALFGFTGSVTALAGSTVFSNGFALDFNPGSSMELTGATYESTHSTDIGGTVTVNAGTASTIKVENNRFLTFESTSSTTLNANLRLENNNIGIDAGATFSGTGAIIVPDGSHVVIDNGATVNVLLVNEGGLRPANSEGVGTVTVKDYSQTSTGELFVEMIGLLPNQFDRIQATGVTQVDGLLHVDLDEVSPGNLFNPALGTTFDIISTVFGVSGQFDLLDYSNLPAGKTFHVDYLANAVRLTVVNRPFFSADFDDDGDVDTTDYAIWRGAFDLNQLGDADGDNDSDAADFVLWRDQLGSVPGAGAGFGTNAAVPEPTSGVLLLAACAAAAVRRRRR